ncbi:MAG TPA: ABC transporter permease, partial [Candidatus Saccharimonadales bacterium]
FSRGSIKTAATTLRSNKGRSLLTMLGIIIGVGSVITVASIGQGVKEQVSQQIDHYGKDMITVRPGQATTSSVGSLKLFTTLQTSGDLSAKDLKTVSATQGVDMAAPLAIIGGQVHAERGAYKAGPVVATGDDFASIVNQGLAYGSFFSSNDNTQNLAVLGANAANAMFNQEVPLGETFTFRGQQFTVRGILNSFGSAPLSADIDFDNAIFIPYDDSQTLTNNTDSIYEILAKPRDSAQADAVTARVQTNLAKLHGYSHAVTVLKQSDSLAATTSVLDTLTELVTGVAAISLLVGGVGIMNVMLVSVAERMHEIGIRKAVGATNRQILSEFMAEALLLSVVGVIIGILVALAANVVLRVLTSLTPTFDWQAMIVAGSVSIVVGILFGTVPALKAARKDPITALRNE